MRFGEAAVDAVRRVALGELGLEVDVGELLGFIEYPSHYNNGLDSPVGLAFRARPSAGPSAGTPLLAARSSAAARRADPLGPRLWGAVSSGAETAPPGPRAGAPAIPRPPDT